ncbi:hypothetical protein SASPL_144523 [Salvia splendens]|uniref:DNA-3-methyladenine glycosylase I n=1 Tax=Salvia splendens TaxID=180675 RepID=A0A8X8WGN9_SALSN|nr:hypothetical protein SASPL_144523 [Salvia splendens]
MCSYKAKLVSNTNGAVRAPLLERRNNADAAGLFLRSKTTDDEPKPGPSPSLSPRLKLLNKSKSFSYSVVEYEAGSIAAARREEVASFHERRRMRIAHYGRTAAAKPSKAAPPTPPQASHVNPIYVAYHDEEWGVPVHNDEKLFELLVLTGAQVGSDWTAVLKKRQDFRDAFSGFDVEVVSKYSEKKMIAISSQYCIQLSHIWDEVGSVDKYLWGFVNEKAIATAYKVSNKIPVKTSKSETISKDMVRRGFRQVGPTVIHSFMQAAGLTNDHLLTCPRHSQILHLHSLHQN